MPEKQTVREINGINYILTRKSVKNVNLRVYADGRVCVSANSCVPLKDIDAFVSKNKKHIIDMFAKAEKRPEIYLIPKEFKEGAEFYFLGKKRTLTSAENNTVTLNGNRFFLPLSDNKKAEKLFAAWLKDQAKTILMQYVNRVYSEFASFKVPYPQITVRRMKSRWGSCNPVKGKITLNLLLLATPPDCIYYVTVHEFAHFIHPDHSKYFWNTVARFVPDYKEKRKRLKEFSAL